MTESNESKWNNHSLLRRARAFLAQVGSVADQADAETCVDAAFTGYSIVASDPNSTNWERLTAANGHMKIAQTWERWGRATVYPGARPARASQIDKKGNH